MIIRTGVRRGAVLCEGGSINTFGGSKMIGNKITHANNTQFLLLMLALLVVLVEGRFNSQFPISEPTEKSKEKGKEFMENGVYKLQFIFRLVSLFFPIKSGDPLLLCKLKSF